MADLVKIELLAQQVVEFVENRLAEDVGVGHLDEATPEFPLAPGIEVCAAGEVGDGHVVLPSSMSRTTRL